jgi:hypothetical protein
MPKPIPTEPYSFICGICGKTIFVEKPWSAEELQKEMIETLGDMGEANNDTVDCCDDCWLKVQHKQPSDQAFEDRCHEVGNRAELEKIAEETISYYESIGIKREFLFGTKSGEKNHEN